MDSEPDARRPADPSLVRRPVYAAVAAIVGAAALTAGVVVAVQPAGPGAFPHPPAPIEVRPQHLALVSYSGCDALRSGLRAHTAASVGAYGLPGDESGVIQDVLPASGETAAGSADAGAAAGAPERAAPQTAHSGTNDQQAGADEPDLVKTDGHRIVSVSGGVLRVIDTATATTTATLDLGGYAGADAAQLLVDGDRALVVLDDGYPSIESGTGSDVRGPSAPTRARSTYLLVDLAGGAKVLSTFRPDGSYVDARLVDGRVRLVVRSRPAITLPTIRPSVSTNRRIVRHAPLAAWLPGYEVTTGGVTTTHDVPCTAVRHPADYTGAAMLTVYTIDPDAGFGAVHPISVAADAATVYATTSSLYVASQVNAYTRGTKTQLHRFDIRGTGRPRYLGSTSLPGSLLSSYSLSDFDGSLRVVTTDSDLRTPATSVYVLDADTLRLTGRVDGLGSGQQVYAVRFAGPLAYVVTFRSVDPLYVLDLHDPSHPRTAGELHVSGYSTYLHPTGSGRLLGVGQDVRDDGSGGGTVAGVQVSLFDVGSPSRPGRLDRVVLPGTAGEGSLDPHAFLYWPATGTAVVPIQSWESSSTGSVLVLHVGRSGLRTMGIVADPDGGAIERSLVIGDRLWTMSTAGFAVRDLSTLHNAGRIRFS